MNVVNNLEKALYYQEEVLRGDELQLHQNLAFFKMFLDRAGLRLCDTEACQEAGVVITKPAFVYLEFLGKINLLKRDCDLLRRYHAQGHPGVLAHAALYKHWLGETGVDLRDRAFCEAAGITMTQDEFDYIRQCGYVNAAVQSFQWACEGRGDTDYYIGASKRDFQRAIAFAERAPQKGLEEVSGINKIRGLSPTTLAALHYGYVAQPREQGGLRAENDPLFKYWVKQAENKEKLNKEKLNRIMRKIAESDLHHGYLLLSELEWVLREMQINPDEKDALKTVGIDMTAEQFDELRETLCIGSARGSLEHAKKVMHDKELSLTPGDYLKNVVQWLKKAGLNPDFSAQSAEATILSILAARAYAEKAIVSNAPGFYVGMARHKIEMAGLDPEEPKVWQFLYSGLTKKRAQELIDLPVVETMHLGISG